MALTLQPKPFPVRRTTIELSLAAVAAALLATGLWVAVGRQAFAGPVLAVCGWVWACTVASMFATAKAARLSTTRMVRVSMGSTLLRFAACLGGCILLVLKLGMPADTVMISLAIVYIPLLFVEVGRVGHYLWHKGHSGNLG